jgi:hypothetical protein
MVTEVLVILSLMVIYNGDINFRHMLIAGRGSTHRMLTVTTSGEVMFIS